MQSHEAALRELESSIGDNIQSLPEEYYRPVAINLQPQERVLTMELINTGKEEKFFKKVLAVFAFLCDEIRELNDIAESHFFPKLLMFGTAASSEDGEIAPPGQAEEQMGCVLPFFQVSVSAACVDVSRCSSSSPSTRTLTSFLRSFSCEPREPMLEPARNSPTSSSAVRTAR